MQSLRSIHFNVQLIPADSFGKQEQQHLFWVRPRQMAVAR